MLEPDEPLRTARRALYAGCAALADALAVHAPPEKPIDVRLARRDPGRWRPGRRRAARLADGAHENEPPAWLVFGAMIRTVAMGEERAGPAPAVAALEEEGFDDLGSGRLVESFARHLMVATDAWQEQGFGEVAKNYLARLPRESGVRRDIDENGDLLVRRMGKAEVERHRSCRRWPAVVARSENGGPRA